ncbi:MAG: 50S ribosomal protein L4 [Chloroflexi bacterium]|nr:50S ribosomal protein L4 [Chloroflexota bacterium]MDA8189824.1 50S ribosomal protein L4 [Dehalococcoidales bacterium]
MELPVYNVDGEVVDNIKLRDDVFAVPMNTTLVHQAMLRQLANRRVGTAQTKTRGNISGGGRKPYRQKGTGRARQGSTRAPHFRGGGIVFGPHPRSYGQDMPKKARRLAIKCVLSAKALEGHLVVLNELQMAEPRTKEMVALLGRLPVQRSVIIALPQSDDIVLKSARNIPDVETTVADSLSVIDVLRHEYLVVPIEAVRKIENQLASPAEE